MNEEQIIASTFFHSCDISRMFHVKQGNITREERKTIASNVPCAVSGGKGSANQSNGEYQPIQYVEELFINKDVDIKAGDLILANVYGEKISYVAGEGRKYASHQQIPLLRKGRA